MAEVTVLPGVNRPDLVKPISASSVLQSALDAGLVDVAIVGRTADGELSLWNSSPDGDAVIGLFMRGATKMARAGQLQPDGNESA